jgi:hypothetical protein
MNEFDIMPFCSKNSVGKIKTVALTNFDTDRLQIILENGIPVVSNQVYSSIYLYMEDLLCLLLYGPKISERWLHVRFNILSLICALSREWQSFAN